MELTLSKRNEQTLAVKFKTFSRGDVALIKQIRGRKWILEESIWSLPYTIEIIEQFLEVFSGCQIHVEDQLLNECDLLQSRFASPKGDIPNPIPWHSLQEQKLKNELLLRGYSPKTIKAYIGQTERYFAYVFEKSLSSNEPMLQPYSLSLLNRKCSHAYVNQAISAVKFYFQKVLQQEDTTPYIRPKKENKLPFVLSLEDVKSILKATPNLKHKAILYLTYSSGLRVGEVVRLRLEDLDRGRQTLRIRQGKGRKDRLTLLSEHAYDIVHHYVGNKKSRIPGYFLDSPKEAI